MSQRVVLHANLVNASSSGTFTSTAFDCRSFSNLTLYATGNGTISGGVVVVEEAPTSDYTGTWSAISVKVTPSDVSGTVTKAYHVTTGCYAHVRARITTQISGGGTWSLDLRGN